MKHAQILSQVEKAISDSVDIVAITRVDKLNITEKSTDVVPGKVKSPGTFSLSLDGAKDLHGQLRQGRNKMVDSKTEIEIREDAKRPLYRLLTAGVYWFPCWVHVFCVGLLLTAGQFAAAWFAFAAAWFAWCWLMEKRRQAKNAKRRG